MAEDDIPKFKWKISTTLGAMTRWIKSARLSLGATKTEVVLLHTAIDSVPLLSPKRGVDMALYSPEVFEVMV